MTAADFFAYLAIGLAFPLAVLDFGRTFFGNALPYQGQVRKDEARIPLWLWTVFVGPGLFVQACTERWRAGDLEGADIVNAAVISAGWAALYGYLLCALTTSVQF